MRHPVCLHGGRRHASNWCAALGVEVVSSAELIQTFEARWTPEALESHLEAGRRVDRIRAEAFALIRERTRNGAPLQEIEVKRFVLEASPRPA